MSFEAFSFAGSFIFVLISQFAKIAETAGLHAARLVVSPTGPDHALGAQFAPVTCDLLRISVGPVARDEHDMSKAFTKESSAEDDDAEELAQPALPAGTKNYITPQGYARLRAELLQLIDSDRPKVVEIVSWAASNGDRSENGDYLYGKKRLREIDRRIRFLTKRLDLAEVADPSVHHGSDQIFFGATVTYANSKGEQRSITIKGVDEVDNLHGEVSWVAPIARALLKAREGDEVQLMTPGGIDRIEVLRVRYPAPGTA